MRGIGYIFSFRVLLLKVRDICVRPLLSYCVL